MTSTREVYVGEAKWTCFIETCQSLSTSNYSALRPLGIILFVNFDRLQSNKYEVNMFCIPDCMYIFEALRLNIFRAEVEKK